MGCVELKKTNTVSPFEEQKEKRHCPSFVFGIVDRYQQSSRWEVIVWNEFYGKGRKLLKISHKKGIKFRSSQTYVTRDPLRSSGCGRKRNNGSPRNRNRRWTCDYQN